MQLSLDLYTNQAKTHDRPWYIATNDWAFCFINMYINFSFHNLHRAIETEWL